MSVDTIYLHIGLPKTATTFLQNAVFKHLKNIAYINRREAARYFSEKYGFSFRRAFGRKPEFWIRAKNNKLGKFVREYAGSARGILISEENISVSARFFDEESPDVSPEQFLAHIRAMRVAANDAGIEHFKIIVTIRRQDTWLASRYAQSAPRFAEPGQQHFLQCVEEILDRREPFAPRSLWIDYGYLASLLQDEFRRGDLLIIPQERLRRDAEGTVSQIGEFLGELRLEQRLIKKRRQRSGPSNNLGAQKWRLRQTDGTIDNSRTIHLDGQLEERILSRYRDSNRTASSLCNLSLDELGYF